ncbi:MAG: PTS mannose/fructose/sorbose/N-acetylgalactosamine transporter subunit IIC [Erysipelotrichaceae bacterium]
MELQFWQVLLLTVWSGVAMLDALSFNIGMNGIIQTGIFTGLVVGDVNLGLVVGGTLQSYALGIGTYGGASIPNWTTAAMLVTALAGGMENADTYITLVGVPIAALTIQFDVMARFANTAFQHRADAYALKGDFKKIELMNWLGTIPWSMSRALPVFFALLIGPELVEGLSKAIPADLITGFRIAGRILPAVGFTILLRYLPTTRNVQYLLIGFVLAAYLSIPILGISLVGLAAAVMIFKKRTEEVAVVSGGDEYDE